MLAYKILHGCNNDAIRDVISNFAAFYTFFHFSSGESPHKNYI